MNFDDPRTWADRRPPSSDSGPDPNVQRLYDTYAAWTGQLHHYCERELRQSLDVEFFPDEWVMRLYPPNSLDVEISRSGIPGLVRPAEACVFRLLKPEADPSPEELEQSFRALCYAAALVLKIDLGKAKLGDGSKDTRGATTLLPFDES